MDNTSLLVVPDILIAENVFLSKGKKDILTGATIRAEKGHITGLLGSNGAGKSTLLQSFFGTRSPQECDVSLNGVRIKEPYTIYGLVNYLPQKPFLPSSLAPAKAMQQYSIDVAHILHHFPELEQYLHLPVSKLSGGIERLFSVLLILLAPARFTLLDEPFTHIMPLHTERLKEIMYRQKEKKGIIITDHLYRHLLDLSDKIYLMKEGRSIIIRDWNDLVTHGYVNHLPQEYD